MIVLNNLLVVGALNAIKEKGFQALERRRVAVRTLWP
jgi:DNA-binding transcriptional regulator YbjK